MGDRANVHFVDQHDDSGIYLYTHWGGTNLPVDLQRALCIARPRWDDSPYATRIIVSQIIGESWDGETGYGLSTQVGDGDGRVLTVDFHTHTVLLGDQAYTFEEYIAAEDLPWPEEE